MTDLNPVWFLVVVAAGMLIFGAVWEVVEYFEKVTQWEATTTLIKVFLFALFVIVVLVLIRFPDEVLKRRWP